MFHKVVDGTEKSDYIFLYIYMKSINRVKETICICAIYEWKLRCEGCVLCVLGFYLRISCRSVRPIDLSHN